MEESACFSVDGATIAALEGSPHTEHMYSMYALTSIGFFTKMMGLLKRDCSKVVFVFELEIYKAILVRY